MNHSKTRGFFFSVVATVGFGCWLLTVVQCGAQPGRGVSGPTATVTLGTSSPIDTVVVPPVCSAGQPTCTADNECNAKVPACADPHVPPTCVDGRCVFTPQPQGTDGCACMEHDVVPCQRRDGSTGSAICRRKTDQTTTLCECQ